MSIDTSDVHYIGKHVAGRKDILATFCNVYGAFLIIVNAKLLQTRYTQGYSNKC